MEKKQSGPKLRKFFIACSIGVEEELAKELREVWPFLKEMDGNFNSCALPEFEFFMGGIEFEAPLAQGLQLNFFLKLANRILLRVDQFRAVEFPKLFHRAMQIDWAPYLTGNDSFPVELEVSAEKSKLGHEKKISQVLKEVLEKRKFKMASAKSEGNQKLFVRFSNDVCTISLDTSGTLLHKRGTGELKGEAPLRETWAAFCLRVLMGDRPITSLKKVTLIDPMAGSGTFLTEARSLLAANVSRKFAFQNWKLCPAGIKTSQFLSQKKPTVFANYFAIDADSKMNDVILENWQNLTGSKEDITVAITDSSQKFLVPEGLAGERWLICNPPYGDRIEIEGGANHQELLNHWADHLGPQKMAMLIPTPIANKLKPPRGYISGGGPEFKNGGIPVTFVVFVRLP